MLSTSSFRKTAFGLTTAAIVGASVLGAFPVAAQQTATPISTTPEVTLKKLTQEQCQFMTGHALGMDKSLHHFSPEFKHSIGNFVTRNIDCSGKPVFTVMTPEDDRGIGILGKLMFDNKQGNLYDVIYIYDPNGVAEISRRFRPNQVLRTLPPELAANGPVGGPGG